MTDLKTQAENKRGVSIAAQLIAAKRQQPEEGISIEVIVEIVKKVAEMQHYKGSVEGIAEEILARLTVRMGKGISLISKEEEHDALWLDRLLQDPQHLWTYSDTYSQFLGQDAQRPPEVIATTKRDSREILKFCGDPGSNEGWRRFGLVVGQVQSGKTSNYLNLIGHAADAGYRLIIVAASTTNSLRTQTQIRVDEGFIGRKSNLEARAAKIGVGLLDDNDSYPHPVSLTSITDDFNKKQASTKILSINDIKKPVVLVIKKNVSVLKTLRNWLESLNQGGRKHIDLPMLLIDDEADFASINTSKLDADADPTRTNAEIRQLLNLFSKSCYVGYTATPFANIFISPDMSGELPDLFPRHFIHCLDAPTNYMGPASFFPDSPESDGTEEKLLQVIDDMEACLPLRHKKEHALDSLPPSLLRAIRQFVIVRTARNIGGAEDRHCSMLINVSRFIDVQRQVRDKVGAYLDQLQNAVQANYCKPETEALQDEHMKALHETFLEDFEGEPDCRVSWSQIQPALFTGIAMICTKLINSSSRDVLHYSAYDAGKGFSPIAVGGMTLSRGLTLEGLCISYFHRSSMTYDTLLQMGRWFGYHPRYNSLCRLHLTEGAIDWYTHIARASEELRQQFLEMHRSQQSPKDFGLYVRTHPATLKITAANKMRTGEVRKISYADQAVRTHRLPMEKKSNGDNVELLRHYWQNQFGSRPEKDKGGWIQRDVPTEVVVNFLEDFKYAEGIKQHTVAPAIEYLTKISGEHPHTDVILTSLVGESGERSIFIGSQEVGIRQRTARDKEGVWEFTRHEFLTKDDGAIGLSAKQKAEAKGKSDPRLAYRRARGKPYLIISILHISKKKDATPAFQLFFPKGGETAQEVDVVVNQTYRQMELKMYGGEDEDQDDS